jgi:hypothetical protein
VRDEWQLFVDESGDFDAPDDGARVVGGLLLHSPPSVAQKKALRDALATAVPGADYPPHAAWLNLPVGRLACTVLSRAWRETRPEAAAFREPCEAAIGALEACGGLAAGKFLDAVRRCELPDYRCATECGAMLQARRPEVFGELRALAERYREGMLALLETVAEACGKDGAFVLAAASTTEEAPEAAPSGPAAEDAYLALLQAMFERAFALLRGPAVHDVHVWAHVARRNVTLSPGVKQPLVPGLVGKIVERAAAFPLLPAEGLGDKHVRIVTAGTPAYDANVHPGVVLADCISNRLRFLLRVSRTGWQPLRRRAAHVLALPLEAVAQALANEPPLPALAAGGAGRAAVLRAFRGEPTAVDGVPAGWQRDEAQQWAEAAGKWRQTNPEDAS